MGFLTVNGEFHEFSGKLLLTHGKWQGLKSDIRVKSIDTKDTTRDKTIVGDGYLNANTYPLITFTSSRITNDTLTGYLTIKGVRKELNMPLTFQNSGSKVSLLISTTLSRKEFNLDFGAMNSLIGDKIEAEMVLVAIQK